MDAIVKRKQKTVKSLIDFNTEILQLICQYIPLPIKNWTALVRTCKRFSKIKIFRLFRLNSEWTTLLIRSLANNDFRVSKFLMRKKFKDGNWLIYDLTHIFIQTVIGVSLQFAKFEGMAEKERDAYRKATGRKFNILWLAEVDLFNRLYCIRTQEMTIKDLSSNRPDTNIHIPFPVRCGSMTIFLHTLPRKISGFVWQCAMIIDNDVLTKHFLDFAEAKDYMFREFDLDPIKFFYTDRSKDITVKFMTFLKRRNYRYTSDVWDNLAETIVGHKCIRNIKTIAKFVLENYETDDIELCMIAIMLHSIYRAYPDIADIITKNKKYAYHVSKIDFLVALNNGAFDDRAIYVVLYLLRFIAATKYRYTQVFLNDIYKADMTFALQIKNNYMVETLLVINIQHGCIFFLPVSFEQKLANSGNFCWIDYLIQYGVYKEYALPSILHIDRIVMSTGNVFVV